jgi:hypothetical protein
MEHAFSFHPDVMGLPENGTNRLEASIERVSAISYVDTLRKICWNLSFNLYNPCDLPDLVDWCKIAL